jgi:hypothetical protein
LIVLHFCLEKKGLGFKDGGAPLWLIIVCRFISVLFFAKWERA